MLHALRRSPRRLLPRSRSVLPVLLAVTATAAAAAGPVTSAADARSLSELQAKLKLESSHLGGTSGAYVVDLTGGRVLYQRNPDAARSPASNEKLFTTATALLEFGADATLATEAKVGTDVGVDDAGVLDGDLYLVGGGDPSLGDTGLQALAGSIVRSTGLKVIKGSVIGDESLFDAKRGGPDSNYAADLDIGGQLGGLTWGHGSVDGAGPAKAAAARLQTFLEKLKVKVRKAPKVGRAADAPGGAGATLGTYESPPMAVLAAETNQPSDNFYAETLLKDLGAHYGTGGTTAAGAQVVSTRLKTLGLAPTIVDGSGLSRRDHTTPRQLVGLLRSMYTSAAKVPFVGSLAVTGKVGTLAGRMRGTAASGRCQAKTGTPRGVSALSGYCRTVTNRIIAFSLMENDMNASSAKAVEDRMVPAIVSYRP